MCKQHLALGSQEAVKGIRVITELNSLPVWGCQGYITNWLSPKSSHQMSGFGFVLYSPIWKGEWADWCAKDWSRSFLWFTAAPWSLVELEKPNKIPHVAAVPPTAVAEPQRGLPSSVAGLTALRSAIPLPWRGGAVCSTLWSYRESAGLGLRCLFSRDMVFLCNDKGSIAAERKGGW